MFGLMKIATHEAEMQLVRNALGYSHFRYANPIEIARQVRDERDEAKTRATTAKAEIVTLKARIAELEKPVTITKPVPAAKAKLVNKTVAVPVKGKVK